MKEIQIALALLPLVQTGVAEFVNWINALRTIAQQDDEWTAAQEETWRDALIDKGFPPEDLPDVPA